MGNPYTADLADAIAARRAFAPAAEDFTDEGDPIYSDEDTAMMTSLRERVEYLTNRAEMWDLSQAVGAAREHFDGVLGKMRRLAIEACAASHWASVERDAQADERLDRDVIQQAELEIRHFFSEWSLGRLLAMQLPQEELHVMEDTDLESLRARLSSLVFGHVHEPIETRKTQRFEVETPVPASWWQHFKRDVLRSKKVDMVNERTTLEATMSVSAVPFSAFPGLPYEPPNSWGPRIRLALPSEPTMNFRKVVK